MANRIGQHTALTHAAIATRLGPTVSFRGTDMLDKPLVQILTEHVVDRLGRLDCMFNNAGGGGGVAESNNLWQTRPPSGMRNNAHHVS